MKANSRFCLLLVILVETIVLLGFIYNSNFTRNIYSNIKKRFLSKIQQVEKIEKPIPLCTEPDLKYSKNRVISYSLFGVMAWSRYGSQIESVAEEASRLSMFGNWSVRIYHDGFHLNNETIDKYKRSHKNLVFCDVNHIPGMGDVTRKNGRVWRFLPVADESVDVTCIRDIDSPVMKRDEDAVKEWLNSTKIFHIMRDHPTHVMKILAGLWCFRNAQNRTLGKHIWDLTMEHAKNRTNTYEASYSDDQDVLKDHVWPLIKHNSVQHDAYACHMYDHAVPFPTKRDDGKFAGCIQPCQEYISICPENCRPPNHKDWYKC